jgi:hypothetical protein
MKKSNSSPKSTDNRQNEIIRIQKKQSNFVILDKGFIEDERLSWKAKGILTYLLSKPDNWKVIVGDLVKQSTDGERAVYSGLNELKKYGYYRKYPVREGQRIVRWESVIYECPGDYQQEEIKKEKKEEKRPKPTEKPQDSLLRGFVHVENEDVDFVDVQNVECNNININKELPNQGRISINQGKSESIENINQPTFDKEAASPPIDNDMIDTNIGNIFEETINNVHQSADRQPLIKILTKQELADKLDIEGLKDKHPDKHEEIVMLYNILCEVLTVENPPTPTFPHSQTKHALLGR